MKKLSVDEILKRFRVVHRNKYDYSKFVYTGLHDKSIIVCPIHGEFEQIVANHLKGEGCPACGKALRSASQSMGRKAFIEKARKVHGDKYDYSKVEYVNNKTKVCIICPVHGEFKQRPDEHLKGRGCQKCVGRNRSKEDFILEAEKIHKGRYDYSNVIYEASEKKVEIKCNKCGKTFFQKPWVHLQGHGCPYCKMSLGELEIMNMLDDNHIEYTFQASPPFLGNLSLDFLIGNIAIEVQGEQHFKGSRCFGGEDHTEKIMERDEKKYNLCKENGIDILYYTHKFKPKIDTYMGFITEDKQLLLERIQQDTTQ